MRKLVFVLALVLAFSAAWAITTISVLKTPPGTVTLDEGQDLELVFAAKFAESSRSVAAFRVRYGSGWQYLGFDAKVNGKDAKDMFSETVGNGWVNLSAPRIRPPNSTLFVTIRLKPLYGGNFTIYWEYSLLAMPSAVPAIPVFASANGDTNVVVKGSRLRGIALGVTPRAQILEVNAPLEVQTGSTFNVTVTVYNSGNGTGILFVELQDASTGSIMGRQEVSLEPGQSATLFYRVLAPEEGVLKLRVVSGYNHTVTDERLLSILVRSVKEVKPIGGEVEFLPLKGELAVAWWPLLPVLVLVTLGAAALALKLKRS